MRPVVPTVRKKKSLIADSEAMLLKRIRAGSATSRFTLARELNLAPSAIGIYVERLIR